MAGKPKRYTAAEIERELIAAQLEEAHRHLVARSLAAYVERTNPGMVLGAWQHALCAALQRFTAAVEARESPRLMIFAPPQHGKSTLVSMGWPAWLLSTHPDWPMVIASHGVSLAERFSRWVRNTLADPRNVGAFPAATLADDSKSVGDMALTAGGALLARGVGSGTVGRSARVFVVDDPFADREQAESKLVRDKVEEWYDAVATTRLAPGGGILVMHQRWHQDDLAGRLLEKPHLRPGADVFETLVFPALSAQGTALHPERYSVTELESKRANLTPRDWLSLYQQTPTSDAGDYIRRTDLRTYAACPPVGARYLSLDAAVKTGQDNDYSAAAPFGLTEGGDLCFGPEILRERLTVLDLCNRVLDMCKRWDCRAIVTERGVIEGVLGPILRKMMAERGCWYAIETTPVRGDKLARARSFQGRTQAARVLWPAGTLFDEVICPELTAFPAGRNDDLLDMAAQASLFLDRLSEHRPEVKKPPTQWELELNRKRRILKQESVGEDPWKLFAGER